MGTLLMPCNEKAIGNAARQLPRSSKPPSKSERAPVHEPVASARPRGARARGRAEGSRADSPRGDVAAPPAARVLRRVDASAGRLTEIASPPRSLQ